MPVREMIRFHRFIYMLPIVVACASFAPALAAEIALTQEEAAWIAQNPTIRVHNETDWPPFNFAQDGKPLGFSIDYMNLLAARVGLKVKYVTGPSWSDFLEMMKRGELEVMLNIVKTPDRLKYLLYTPPYAHNPNTILSRKDAPYKNLTHLFGKTVSVPKGFFYEEILKREFPQITVLPLKNMFETMQAVSDGRADAALGELAVFNHLVAEREMHDLIISGEILIGSPELALLNIATRNDLPILAAILTKGVKAIGFQEKQTIQRKWLGTVHITGEPIGKASGTLGLSNFVLYFVAAVLATILGIVFIAWLVRGRPKQISIRETLFLTSFVFACLIVAIGILVTLLLKGEQVQVEIAVRKDTSLKLALELRQSSDDLTRFARLFAVTGDPVYERYFKAILDIRDGKRGHPKNYTQSFWDQLVAGQAELNFAGQRYSIEQKMLELGLVEAEKDLLTHAKKVSDDLINLENVAMNAVRGRFKGMGSTFTITDEPNLKLARDLLHGPAYHAAKAKIMKPIDDFFRLLETRTTGELTLERDRNKEILLAITLLIILTIVFAVYAFFMLKRRIIFPLLLLEDGALALRDGAYSSRVEITSEDEVGTLAQSFNSMASRIEDRTGEVAEKERLLRLAMDNMPGGMFLADRDQNFLLFNRQYSELFDFPDDLIAEDRPLLDMIHFQAQRGDYGSGRFVEKAGEMMRLFRSEKHHHYERHLPNGRILGVNLAPTPDGGTVAVATDITERKKAEEDLQNSEKRIRAIIDNAADGIIIINEKGEIESFSPAAEIIFGYTPNEVIGKNIKMLMPEPWRSEHDGHLERYMQTGEARIVGTNREVVGLRKDGTEFPMDLAVGEAVLGNERIFTGMARDITERKRTEAEISMKSEILEATLENMNQGIMMLDQEGRIVAWNEKFSEMRSLPEEFLNGRPTLEDIIRYQAERNLYRELDGDVESQVKARLEVGKETEPSVYEQIRPGGITQEIHSNPLSDGKIVRTYSDITDRKEAEEELNRQKTVLEATLENMDQGIGMWDGDLNLVAINSKLKGFLDLPDALLEVGTPVEDWYRHMAKRGEYKVGEVHAFSEVEETVAARIESVRQSESLHYERELWDGRTADIRRSIVKSGGFVSTYTDITDRKAAERAIADAKTLIDESISYASRIQRSTLPDQHLLGVAVSDNFVIWEPRDVVGGDIYWLLPVKDGYILGVADCTGHGVPGAFLTLVATSALRFAVAESPDGTPAQLIASMNYFIKDVLAQYTDDAISDDGLELGICLINTDSNSISFSGARFSLWIVQNGEVQEIKGDKTGIGYTDVPVRLELTNHAIQQFKGASFYMFSDGFNDQIGGDRGRGFGKRRMLDLLVSLSDQPMASQRDAILTAFAEYQGDELRRDDLTMVGFRL